jgi:hypothetical protein
MIIVEPLKQFYMGRPKYFSEILATLIARVNGLKVIHANLVLKMGLSVAAGEDLKTRLQTKQDEYNHLLSLLDLKRYELDEVEKEANRFNKTLFLAVKAEYGEDSAEYETVGGRRSSDRKQVKKPVAKKI